MEQLIPSISIQLLCSPGFLCILLRICSRKWFVSGWPFISSITHDAVGPFSNLPTPHHCGTLGFSDVLASRCFFQALLSVYLTPASPIMLPLLVPCHTSNLTVSHFYLKMLCFAPSRAPPHIFPSDLTPSFSQIVTRDVIFE